MPTITADDVLLTTDDYHRMIAAGILTEDDRVELIDGKIVPMAAVENRHVYCVNRLTRLFVENTDGAEVEVSIQNPVEIGPHQEPEPDIALFRPPAEPRLPIAADVFLLIEVADSTLRKDRDVKHLRYAEARIPAYWIINLEDASTIQVDVYTRPEADGYADHTTYHADDEFTLPHAGIAIRPRDPLA